MKCEYLRERGGYLAIELQDLAYAIELGDASWVARFLERFPTLRQGRDVNGKPFRELAEESGNPEVMAPLSIAVRLHGTNNKRSSLLFRLFQCTDYRGYLGT